METSRRRFVSLLATLPLTGLLSASFRGKFLTLPVTPPCDDHDEPTPWETEGPYFKPNSPERSSLLEQGMGGSKLVLTGRVLTTDCKPVAHALLDWWHADNEGEYDNSGFRLRGHQYTDKNGIFRLETIVPGLYPGRTRHVHVKVQAPNKPVLTTQLYFPDEPGNRRDGLFNSNLLMNVTNKGANVAAGYTFVVKA